MKMISMVGQMNCKWTDIRDELLVTDLEFNNVDYLEAYRYLVLNWTQEEASRSNLRRGYYPLGGGRGGQRETLLLFWGQKLPPERRGAQRVEGYMHGGEGNNAVV